MARGEHGVTYLTYVTSMPKWMIEQEGIVSRQTPFRTTKDRMLLWGMIPHVLKGHDKEKKNIRCS